MTPRQAAGHLSAQLESKLRRPLLKVFMMTYIFFNHLTRHSVPNGPSKISIFPQFPSPQPSPQPRKLAKQLPPRKTLYDPYHLAYRVLWPKRNQQMDVFFRHLKFLYFKVISFGYLPHQLLRSLPYDFFLKNIPPIFWTPDQMVPCLVNRMTRSFQTHATCLSFLSRKGKIFRGAIRAQINQRIHPRGKPRGILRMFAKKDV
jgi:hypothetical protein